jgi:deazaflavin-dependent oxidoreductase (nitroreductase family)
MQTTPMTAEDIARRRRTFFWVRTFLSPLAKLILSSPLHGFMSHRIMLITFTGRKSGKRYTTPIAYVCDSDTLLLGVGSSWWKNLRDGAHVQVRLRGHTHTGVTSVVRDEIGMSEAYRMILARNPTQARFMGIKAEPDGQPTPRDVRRAIQRGSAVVRVRLAD